MKVPYYMLNAFTNRNSDGNPAACIYLDESQQLSGGQMQRIAKVHKGFVSEVVFCRQTEQEGIQLKYYSSECEVDFCGHGTIACIYNMIQMRAKLLAASGIPIHTNKGAGIVINSVGTEDCVYISAPKPQYSDLIPVSGLIATALNIAPDCIDVHFPISHINAGLSTLLVPISTLDDLLSVNPDQEQLKSFCLFNSIDIVLIYSFKTQDNSNFIRSRVFAPKYGYLEDPATGSGNSSLGYYLLDQNLWDGRPICIEQNNQKEAYNTVRLKSIDNVVYFGGAARIMIEGFYYI